MSRIWTFAAAALGFYISVSATHASTALPIAEFRQICQRATEHAESMRALPANLLTAISFAESAQWDDEQEAIFAWPWTVNSGGTGRYFPDKQSAIAYVRKLKRAGVSNIDVGCMQVNLHYHPDAFANLDEAFDPRANALYAAKFLGDLHRDNNSWADAIRRYHSADPERGNRYRARVLKFWDNDQKIDADAYRQSVIAAYKQRRAERQRERALQKLVRAR